MSDVQTPAAPSTAESTTPATETQPIENWSDAQRDTWLKSGETPKKAPSTADTPAPAKDKKPAAPAADAETETSDGEEDEGESDPDDKATGEQDTGEPAQQKRGRRARAQARIRELATENRVLREQLAQRNAPPAAPPADAAAPKEPPKKKSETLVEPNIDDFETPEAWQDAHKKYTVELTAALIEEALEGDRAQRQQETALDAVQESWNEAQADFRAQKTDYDQVMKSVTVPNTPAMAAMYEALLSHEDGLGPAIAYEICKKGQAELDRLAKMTPAAAVRALGRIEATLTSGKPASEKTPATAAAPATPQKKHTTASPPPAELGARASAINPLEAAVKANDFGAYMAAANARDLGKK